MAYDYKGYFLEDMLELGTNYGTFGNNIKRWVKNFIQTKTYTDGVKELNTSDDPNVEVLRNINTFWDSPLIQLLLDVSGLDITTCKVKVGTLYDTVNKRETVGRGPTFGPSIILDTSLPNSSNYAILLNIDKIRNVIKSSYSNFKVKDLRDGSETKLTYEEVISNYGDLYISKTPGDRTYNGAPFKTYFNVDPSGTRTLRYSGDHAYIPYLEVKSSGGKTLYIPLSFNYTISTGNEGPDLYDYLYINDTQGSDGDYTSYSGNLSDYRTSSNDFKILSFNTGAIRDNITIMYNKETVINSYNYFGISNITESVEEAINKNTSEFPEAKPGIWQGDPSSRPEEDQPTDPTKPGDTTAKGQEENKIYNVSTGTGDFSSDIVIKPIDPGGTAGSFGSCYALNYNQMLKLQGEIWKPAFWESIRTLQNNLNDTIINACFYPFNLIDFSGILDDNKVILGNYNIDMSTLGDVWKLYPNYTPKIYLIDNYILEPIYGSFLDYEPYTKMMIYLPYVGFQPINPVYIYNKKLSIYYNVDIISNTASCNIEVNDNIIYSYSCCLGSQIALNNSNYGEIRSSLVKNTIGSVSDLTLSSIAPLVNNMTNAQFFSTIGRSLSQQSGLAAYNTAKDSNMNFGTIGTTGDSVMRMSPQYAYIIIETVNTSIPELYNKNIGRPSLISEVLNNLKGYTEIINPILDISTATDTEKEQILSILTSGFIIK